MTSILVLVFAATCFVETRASSLIHKSIEMCGNENEIILTEDGESSSTIIALSLPDHVGACKLKISAPSTHVVNMQFVETNAELQKAMTFNSTHKHPPCMMSVYLPENRKTAIWKGDPCSNDVLPETDLLTPEFRIVWLPPSDLTHTKGRKFILTAVGIGDICSSGDRHVCKKIGWKPHLCISKHLLCDGNQNCPKGATKSDEDEVLCKSHLSTQKTLEQLVELIKKFKPTNDLIKSRWNTDENSTVPLIPKKSLLNWREWEELKKAENKLKTNHNQAETTQNSVDSVSEILSSYGPWGYLMLGMLICGTVLMFCGLWECCFRKPKPLAETQSQTPPTTVLIINHQQQDEVINTGPPNYEDLDQPPSYSTLFPNYKFNNNGHSSVTEIEVQEIVPNPQNSDTSQSTIENSEQTNSEVQVQINNDMNSERLEEETHT